jgi:glycerol-3-phosphate dehydrogenase
MKRNFDGLSNEKFDLVVIGGGVIGTGVARDAAMRGIRTLLVEKEDFGYGTTSRSTRLIHGGLRYLSHLDFKLVKMDLREREILLKLSPNLVKPLPFLLPLTSLYQHFVMGVGMRIYDRFSRGKSLPSFRHLSRQRTMEMEPGLALKGLRGAYEFYDAQIALPERLCVENALSAAQSSATLVNHAAVVGIVKAGNSVDRVKIKDGLSRAVTEVQTRAVVSVAGHWTNDILTMAAGNTTSEIRTTLGIHLVTPKISNRALVLFARSDGRLVFVIPWQEYSLIGTTDTVYSGDKDHIAAEAAHVDYLIDAVKPAFPNLKAEDIHWTFAGLRSLVGAKGKKVSNVSRSHLIVDHEVTDGVAGFVSILGGKMTGYRSIAEETVDLLCKKLGVEAACRTAETAMPGAAGLTDEQMKTLAAESGLAQETVAHLNSIYGSRATEVIKMAAADEHGKKPLCSHSKDIVAQVWHAVEEEACKTPADFLLRRGTCGLASCQGLDAVETVAVEMARKLGWSIGEWQEGARQYRDFVAANTQYKKVMFAPS